MSCWAAATGTIMIALTSSRPDGAHADHDREGGEHREQHAHRGGADALRASDVRVERHHEDLAAEDDEHDEHDAARRARARPGRSPTTVDSEPNRYWLSAVDDLPPARTVKKHAARDAAVEDQREREIAGGARPRADELDDDRAERGRDAARWAPARGADEEREADAG